MTSPLNFSFSTDFSKNISNNSALKASVDALGKEIEALFSSKLNTLLSEYSSASEQTSTVETVSTTATTNIETSSTLSFVNQGSTPSLAPPVNMSTQNISSGNWTAPWLADSAQGASFLLSAPITGRNEAKPDLKEFMDTTGVSADTAISLLYGVVGANNDVRDWQKIMVSAEPLTAARSATAAMYSAANPTLAAHDRYQIPAGEIVAKTENFSWSKTGDRSVLSLTDSQGNKLREVGLSAPHILETLQSFGMDPTQLSELADQLDAKGINYKPFELYAGSDAGVDLRKIAQGDPLRSMAYDWRTAKNMDLARDLGLA